MAKILIQWKKMGKPRLKEKRYLLVPLPGDNKFQPRTNVIGLVIEEEENFWVEANYYFHLNLSIFLYNLWQNFPRILITLRCLGHTFIFSHNENMVFIHSRSIWSVCYVSSPVLYAVKVIWIECFREGLGLQGSLYLRVQAKMSETRYGHGQVWSTESISFVNEG